MRIREGERGESMLELMLWVGMALAVAAVAGYVVFMRPWEDKPIKLTPEQQVYVQAVATQQADTYLRTVATQAAQAQVSAPPQSAPQQPSSYQPPAPSAPRPTSVPAQNPPALS